jgi:hypothetical protein
MANEPPFDGIWSTIKIQTDFAISSHEVMPDTITKELGISPTECHAKGEIYVGKKTKKEYKRFQNIWRLSSPEINYELELGDNTPVPEQIRYFKNLFDGKLEILKKFKNDPRYECSIWITIISFDSFPPGFYIPEEDLIFLYSYVNFIHFFVSRDNPAN